MNLRRDRKRSLKFREMLETQGYAQAQDAEEREKLSQREVYRCADWSIATLFGVKTVELDHTSQSEGGV